MPVFEHCQTCIKTFHRPQTEAPVVPEGRMCGACVESQRGQLAGLQDEQVLVRFSLPHGMTSEDLTTLLRDSFDDFKTIRCNGDAQAYVHKHYWQEIIQSASMGEAEESRDRKIHQVQTRFNQVSHFRSGGSNMSLVCKRTDLCGEDTGDACDCGKAKHHNQAIDVLTSDDD